MRGLKSGLRVMCVLALLLPGIATMRAQLIPLLPPIMDEPAEAAPQQSKAAQELQGYLMAEQFDRLDQIADRQRSNKTRVAGGAWKLRQFYAALDMVQPSDEAMEAYLAHFEHWMAAKPESITAAVAMAASLERWAWAARGSGYANTVTQEGWRLFNERIDRADKALEGAAKFEPMCPEWYSKMLTVGTAKGWDAPRMLQIFEEGTKLEPEYFYLYRQRAYYLLPKWYGKPGDASAFAKESADKMGGDAGDELYFHIAQNLIRRGDGGFPVKEMDWTRIQHGQSVAEQRYGASKGEVNDLAFMAYKCRDAATAQRLFQQIGEKWSVVVWGKKEVYDQARQWAAGKLTPKGPSAAQEE